MATSTGPSGTDPDRPGQDKEDPYSHECTFNLAVQLVIFNTIGKYATDVTFAHIEINVPFGHYIDMMGTLNEDIQRAYNISK